MNRLLKKAEDKGFSPIPSGKNSVRQLYHLEPEKGLLNDPVGLIQFRGEYHVFFSGTLMPRTIPARNGAISLLRTCFHGNGMPAPFSLKRNMT